MKKLYIFIVCAFLLVSTRSVATIYYVNINVIGGTGTGLSWVNAYADLQLALNVALPGDQVWVAKGTYLPSVIPSGNNADPRDKAFYFDNGGDLYGGFAGTESSILQRVPGNITYLSGDIGNATDVTDNCYNVVVSSSQFFTFKLDGFTITNGNASGTGFSYGTRNRGGGMTCTSSSLTNLSNVIFLNNAAPGISHTGGGMYMFSCSVILSNVDFLNNSSDFGGGMQINSASPVLTNVTFSGNSCTSNGGAIYNASSPSTLTNVVFINNTAILNGGGIYNLQSSPTLTNIIFSENNANKGGGIFNETSSPGLFNVVFSANIAGVTGGGMYNIQSSPGLTNVSFYSNTASTSGGGIYNAGDMTLPTIKNCIFRENTRGGSAIIWGADIENPTSNDPVVTASFTSFQLTNNTTNYPAVNFPAIASSSNLFAQDPKFVNAADPDGADNIWMTADDGLALQNTSPCINAGTSIGAAATDITGAPRVGNTDIGAYENLFVVPVGWLYFNGKTMATDNILTWATASEQNSNYFDIERSVNGIYFSRIGTVIAAGFSDQTRSYQYTDNHIDRLNATNMFYRLKQTDKNGNFKYSNILKLFYITSGKHYSAIYPNPTNGPTTILAASDLLGSVAVLYDINGKKLEEIIITANSQLVDLSSYTNGIYFIKLNNKEVLKLVKQ